MGKKTVTAQNKKEFVSMILTGIFVTNAVLGEVLGVKLFTIWIFTLPLGVLPWPVVFLSTDLINEFYGKKAVRRLTFMTTAMILYMFVIVFAAMQIPAASFSPVNDETFHKVFGQSLWIIAGSVTAFLISQYVDVIVFWIFRKRTGMRMLWLRATGSTIVSQLIDTFVIQGIAFVIPGYLSLDQYFIVAMTSYVYKLAIAVFLTPLIYGSHNLIERYLGKDLTHSMLHTAEEESR